MDGEGNGVAYTLIRDLPASERPRERLRESGPNALSAAELIAILLRTGSAGESALTVAQRLLRDFRGVSGLSRASFGELCGQHGMGEAKAAQILAALELAKRAAGPSREERPVLSTPQHVADLVGAEMAALAQEHVRVMLLDSRNRLTAMEDVYRGSVHTAQVRIGELLREAVKVNAPAMILVHNHPSGDPAPSAADVAMTKQLCEAGKLLDIDVYDHIIIGGVDHVSLRALGLGFPRDGR